MKSSKSHYVIRLAFDAGSSMCLWPKDNDTREHFGNYILPEDLPLSDATIERVNEIVDWYDESLNWDSPADPGPWRQDECDRFNQAVKELVDVVQKELGDDYEIMNESIEMEEDPDLDAYLQDPKSFRRMS